MTGATLADFVADLVACAGLTWDEVLDMSPAQANRVRAAVMRREGRMGLTALNAAAGAWSKDGIRQVGGAFKRLAETTVREAQF